MTPKKAFIDSSLRPTVRGQYYELNLMPRGEEILEEVSISDMKDPIKRRELVVNLLMSKFSPKNIKYKRLLKEIFPVVYKKIENTEGL